MLSFQLRRAQIELQSHQNWLTSFVIQSRCRDAVRNFSSVHRYGLEQEQTRREWNPLARARAKADAEHWKRVGREAEDGAASGKPLSDAKRRKRERYQARRSGPQTVELKALRVREDLMKAVKDNNTAVVFRLYRELPERRPLATDDFRAIAQCTHQALRTENQQPREQQQSERKQEIVQFAELLVKDIRHGNIVPSTKAHTHLLGIFKESGYLDVGQKFWKWLETQDDQHVGTDTYAAAIELLAVHGAPLEDLESLHTAALTRFPGNFSAYHLSPNAILPDREASTTIKGLPLSLLQAITTARLMRGNSRQAYLALDTAFRLYPTAVESRFIKLFLEERPVSEAYTVFALACQAGMTLPSALIRGLLPKIRTSAESDSAQHRIASLQAMVAVMHLYLGSTGKALPNSVAELIIAITTIFRLPGVDEMEGKQRKKLVDAVLLSVRKILETFARFGILPSTSAFNSVLINVAGYGKSKETLHIVLKDFEALNMTQTEVTRRTILAVAGLWSDQAMIEESWDKIIEARRENKQWPDPPDFFVLCKAVRATGKVSYARDQFEILKTFIPVYHHSAIDHAITKAYEPDPKSVEKSKNAEPVSFEILYEGIEKLNADLTILERETRDRPAVQDFHGKTLPLTLLPPEGALNASEEVIRQVYDSMTTDPASHCSRPSSNGAATFDSADADISILNTLSPPSSTSTTPRSSTNLTLSSLRYSTWKNFHFLLQLAEKHDRAYDAIVDQAIREGKVPPKREMFLTGEELERMSRGGGFGIGGKGKGKGTREGSVEEYGDEVGRLRGL